MSSKKIILCIAALTAGLLLVKNTFAAMSPEEIERFRASRAAYHKANPKAREEFAKDIEKYKEERQEMKKKLADLPPEDRAKAVEKFKAEREKFRKANPDAGKGRSAFENARNDRSHKSNAKTIIPTPSVPEPTPVVETPATPVVEVPAPVVATPAAPVVEAPAPVVEAPTVPVVETPAPEETTTNSTL